MLYRGLSNMPYVRAVITEPFVTYDNVVTDDEIMRIVSMCEDEKLERGKTLGGGNRRCDIRFVFPNADNSWLFARLSGVLEMINAAYYGFELNGYDAFQYTRYDSEENGMYGWHMDTFLGAKGLPPEMIQPRKLSLTLNLNEGYEGGDFMINQGGEATTVPMVKARAVVFPSFLLHTIRPVTKGVRRSIVVWVTGPKWR